MAHLYLDPFLFSCPQEESGLEGVHRFINNVIGWRELNEMNWCSIHNSSRTVNVLTRTHSYPLWEPLERTLLALGIRHIQTKDVVTLVNRLLSFPSVEDQLGIREVLLNDVQSQPSEFLVDRHNSFVEEYHRLLVLMGLRRTRSGLPDSPHVLISSELGSNHVTVTIHAKVEEVEVQQAALSETAPIDVVDLFPVCSCPEGFYGCIDVMRLWLTAVSEDGFRAALTAFIYQRSPEPKPSLEAIQALPWRFGASFLDTARSAGFMNEAGKSNALLRACAETILRENLGDVHMLRVGPGGNDPPRMRNNDVGWRRDIDYQYHLHYWQTGNGPELASVVVHNDMRIPM